jgi:hypothetical protein
MPFVCGNGRNRLDLRIGALLKNPRVLMFWYASGSVLCAARRAVMVRDLYRGQAVESGPTAYSFSRGDDDGIPGSKGAYAE